MFNWIVFVVQAGLGVFLAAFASIMMAGGGAGGGNPTDRKRTVVFWTYFLAGCAFFILMAFLNAKYIPFFRDNLWKSILSGILGDIVVISFFEFGIVIASFFSKSSNK